MSRSTAVFGEVLRGALPRLEQASPTIAGTVYRFGDRE
jgi:hypothetical protein